MFRTSRVIVVALAMPLVGTSLTGCADGAADGVPRDVADAASRAPVGVGDAGRHGSADTPDAVTTLAFVGDQGTDPDAEAVLRLVRDEGTDLLVLQGDFGYDERPAAWASMMDRVLGPDFPVLGVAGNHDEREWQAYRDWLAARVGRVEGLTCDGDVGMRALCHFHGIAIAQTAPGVQAVPDRSPDDDYAGFVRDAFAGETGAWRICSFHKNQRAMQTGRKEDETGWPIYRSCLDAGAIVATAHEHAYSRTFLMDDFEAQHVVDTGNRLRLASGRSFAFVSGLGGKSIRWQWRRGDWWASVLTRWQRADYGALSCRFAARTAACDFKDVDGNVRDAFTLESAVGTIGASNDVDERLRSERTGTSG